MAIPGLSAIWQLARRVENIFQDVEKLVRGVGALRDELRDLEKRVTALEGREEMLVEKAKGAAAGAASAVVMQSVADIARRIGALGIGYAEANRVIRLYHADRSRKRRFPTRIRVWRSYRGDTRFLQFRAGAIVTIARVSVGRDIVTADERAAAELTGAEFSATGSSGLPIYPAYRADIGKQKPVLLSAGVRRAPSPYV